MKISVITVCFNSEKTIERTIKSVLNQEYPDIEYILIDGKSSDGTLAIIESFDEAFAEKGYEYRYISEKDDGMYDAMNKGIALASGDLIGMLNSDDWYEANALKAVAKSYEEKQADIYMGAINVINGKQSIIKHAKDKMYKTSRNFNHPAMFVTKECYERMGNYEIGNVHNDYGWYLKACKNQVSTAIIDEVLTNYPTGGAGSKKSLKTALDRIGTKYEVYSRNGYSRLYYIECVVQELAKYLLLKNG